MSQNMQKGIFVLGIIAAIYILIWHIIPFILKLLGIVLSFLFKAALVVGLIVLAYFVVRFIMDLMK